MPLKQTQQWLQSAIVAPNTPLTKAVNIRLTESPLLTPTQRLEIYRDLYPARLVSALKADYPLLYQHLTPPVFTQLALLYAQAHPSRSFTLNAFGQKLPEFLTEIQGLKRPQLAQDIAQFEQTCTHAFHAEEAPALTATQIAQVPEAAWPKAKLSLHPSVRLLKLSYPVWQLTGGTTQLRKRASHVAIHRKSHEVRWLPLTPTALQILEALKSGKPLAQALGNARAPVQQWFRQWVAAGLFTGIRLR